MPYNETLFNEGVGFFRQSNFSEARRCWRLAAAAGHIKAQRVLIMLIYANEDSNLRCPNEFMNGLDRLAGDSHHPNNGWAMVIIGIILCGERHVGWSNSFEPDLFEKDIETGLNLIERGVALAEHCDSELKLTLDDYYWVSEVYANRHEDTGKLIDIEKCVMYLQKSCDMTPPTHDLYQTNMNVLGVRKCILDEEKLKQEKPKEEKLKEELSVLNDILIRKRDLLKNQAATMGLQSWQMFINEDFASDLEKAQMIASELEKLTGREHTLDIYN